MDPSHFDTLTRSLTDARSRRGALGALLGGAFGLLGVRSEEAEAHDTLKVCKKKSGDAKKKCVKKAKKHAAQHAAEASAPPPAGDGAPSPPSPVCTPSCTGKRTCQNGTCACPSGTKFCEFEGECEGCCSNADCCGATPCPPQSQTCVAGGTYAVCGCAPGTELCGGKCLAPCGVSQLRNPVTCGCCMGGNSPMPICPSPPCCGICVFDSPYYFCNRLPSGSSCDFGGQCESGVCTVQPESPGRRCF